MIATYIKYFTLFVCSFIFFSKLLNQKINKSNFFATFTHKKIALIIQATSFLIVDLIIITIRIFIPHLTVLFLFILLYIYASFVYHVLPETTIVTSLISLVLSYFMFYISAIIASPVSLIAKNASLTTEMTMNIFTPIVCLFQIILTFLIFSIKRLKNGMPFLFEKISNKIGVFLSCFVLFISSLFTILDHKNRHYTLLIVFCTFMCFILFIWWRKQLSISYINRTHNNEILSLEAEIKKLNQDNKHMAMIIHKDNKLIPAMIMSVENLLNKASNNNITDTTLVTEATNLLKELNTLSKERTGILSSNSPNKLTFTSTNLIRLDSVIQYMHEKCKAENISFDVSVTADATSLIKKSISEDALVTLVADITENAIIATRNNEDTKNILLCIKNENNTYHIEVYDSGSHFAPHVIKNAGKRPTTTHLDTGGSGIGLMTTFTLACESFASFVINESIEDPKYTKCVSIVFDYKNEFRVYSQRSEILQLKNECPEINIIS